VVVNKSEVIQDVADAAGVEKTVVERVVGAFFDTVREAVGSGDKVAWPSFGAFSATDRQARIGRNPRTGEPVPIAASRAVKFSASTALRAALNPAPAKGAKKGSKTAAGKKAAPGKKSPAAKSAPTAKATTAKKTATKAATAKPAPVKASATKAPATKASATKASAKKATKRSGR